MTTSGTTSTVGASSTASGGTAGTTSGTRTTPGHNPVRRIGLFLLIPPAILALSLIANGARQASERGNATEQAEKALDKAVKKLPFLVRLPKDLPMDARMVRVVLDEPDSEQGFQAYQLNVWYRTKTTNNEPDAEFHVWQSNDKFLARRLRDPLQAVGKPVKIGDQVWHQVTDDRVTGRVVKTFSFRFDNGVTMTVDSKDADLAMHAIRSLQPVGTK